MKTHLWKQGTATTIFWVQTTIFTVSLFQHPIHITTTSSPFVRSFINQHNLPIYSRSPLNISALSLKLILYLDHHFLVKLKADLINCSNIGYAGPQFIHCSNNLHSAYRQLTSLDTTHHCRRLQSRTRFGSHLINTYLLYFCSSGLGPIYPSMMVAGKVATCRYYAPHDYSINKCINSESPAAQWMMLMLS